MRVLKTVHSLNPAGGGVATAVDSLTRAQLALGHEIEVACLDDPSSPWLAGRPYRVHAFRPALLPEYGFSPAFRLWIMENMRRFETATVEGLWQFHGPATRHAARSAGVPYVVYPHGMFDPWFRETYPLKHLKKTLYWRFAEHKVVRDARAVAFTAEEELRRAEGAFSPWRARAVVAPLGVAAPGGDAGVRAASWRERFPALTGRRYILFLGRLDPKKGADLLIQAYAELKSPRCALVIAGPVSDATFVARCCEIAGACGLRDGADIHWTGRLDGDWKWAALESADALVLPSHQENFGYVVAEALAAGVPVLVSERVNIWREIAGDGAGLAAPDTLDGVRKLLAAHQIWTSAEHIRYSDAARKCFALRFQIEAAARRQIEVLGGAD